MQKRSWTGRMVRAVAGLGAAGLIVAGTAATAPSASAQPAPTESVKASHLVKGKSCTIAGKPTQAGANRHDLDSLTPAQVRAQEKRLRVAAKQQGYKASAAAKPVIPVVFHVIDNTAGDSNVTQEQLEKQIKVLNDAYGGKASKPDVNTGVKFELQSVTNTVDDDWYQWRDPSIDNSDDHDAKAALHTGGLETLNVYVTGLSDNLLGYATFPGRGPEVRDGVVMLDESLPGGSAKPYDKGDTLTHEAGHWLNLYHTFQGGCSKKNDRVKDTPAQNDGDNVFSCKESLDTCKQAGRDPVHNYMSYGTDKCLDRFTKGQAKRIIKGYTVLRAP